MRIRSIQNEALFAVDLVEDVGMFRRISVLDGSIYEQFNVNIKRANLGSSERCTAGIQKTVMFLEQQRRGELQTMSPGIGRSPQSAAHCRSSKYIE